MVTSVGRVAAGGEPIVLAVLTGYSALMDSGVALVERVALALRDELLREA